jgi:uncharacterized membrane protein
MTLLVIALVVAVVLLGAVAWFLWVALQDVADADREPHAEPPRDQPGRFSQGPRVTPRPRRRPS